MVVKSQPSGKKGVFKGVGENVDGKNVETEEIALHDPDLYRFDAVAKTISR